MDFTINLIKTQKSKIRIGFGIVAILFSILWFLFSLAEKESIKVFDWVFFIFYITLGLANIIEGTGVSLIGLIGAKAYININDDEIHIKQNAFKKGRTIKWNEIQTIEYKSAQYKITKNDNSSIILEIPTDSYNRVQSMKETIKSFTIGKGIQIE